MKKMLTLVLILGMAAVANAAITDFSGDNTPGAGAVAFSVTDIGEWLDGFQAITIQGAAALTSALGPAAPTDAEFVCTMADVGLEGTYGNGDIWTMISYTDTYPVGVWINANYTDAVIGDILTAYVSLDGDNWTSLGSITIVPEPITIALLGFGGLFLRRRK